MAGDLLAWSPHPLALSGNLLLHAADLSVALGDLITVSGKPYLLPDHLWMPPADLSVRKAHPSLNSGLLSAARRHLFTSKYHPRVATRDWLATNFQRRTLNDF
ncbi:MAG TPA: hypothetical protein VKA60_22235 [Blastocatellia bacterium]|nr:hypothetical protein [Blastocatellia bacterium]